MTTPEISYLALVGPTCVGKTKYSHSILAKFPFELINVDSFQVYDFFHLGTGRSDLRAERAHLYGFQDPNVILAASEYLSRVEGVMTAIGSSGGAPFFEGGSISYLKALMSRYRLQLVGLRPRDVNHAKELIEQRLTKSSEDLLLEEIVEGLKRGYEKTIILQDDVVYLPYVNYLAGRVSLSNTRHRVRENLFTRYETQMKEYENLPVDWYEPSNESLVAILEIADRYYETIQPR